MSDTPINIEGLRKELHERGQRLVSYHHWDPYILGQDRELRSEKLSALAIARIEHERWSKGRFPSIQLCLADAVFSKQRECSIAVRSAVQPFASGFGRLSLADFCGRSWADIFAGTFGTQPSSPVDASHHHLSNEGRLGTVLAGARLFLQRGWQTTVAVSELLQTADGVAAVRRSLESVPGMGPALAAYAMMNLGHLTVKADVHVIAVMGPYLGLAPGASPRKYEEALQSVAGELGLHPFTIDQLVWYTESVSGGASQPTEKAAGSRRHRGDTIENPPAAPKQPSARLFSPKGTRLVGMVRDIQPNRDVPMLELYFSKADSGALPTTNKAPLILVIEGQRWHGTIGITSTNPPYVHTNLQCGSTRRNMTELMQSLRVKDKGRLEFAMEADGVLSLTAVLDHGGWRPGGDWLRAEF